MEWVVTTGRTVEEAKDAALDVLGVDEVDAEFEVLEEPRQGLFGRQRGEARVRARVRPAAPRPKMDRRDRRRRRSGEGETNARSTDGEGATLTEAAGQAPEPVRGGRRGRGGGADGAAGVGEGGRAVTAKGGSGEAGDVGGDGGAGGGGAAGESGGSSRSARRRRRRRSGGAAAEQTGSAEESRSAEETESIEQTGSGEELGPLAEEDENGGAVAEEELSLSDQGAVAEEFLTGLLQRFGVTATTKVVTIDEDTIEVQVEGNDLGLLIGPKGQTLQAVQEMTRTVVQRRSVARTGRILVDVAGYRVRRREALERFTRQVADDVKSSGVQRALEPMSAADRKIVHDTANEIEGVRTVSEGEEPRRRVVILPDTPATAS